MKGLTEKREDGTWRLRGVSWEDIRPGTVLSMETHEKLYWALCKLRDYEDTGLSPDEVERMKWKLLEGEKGEDD
ncbi:MAG: hypothetical protein LIO86_15300 [Lachnospiraceae bacterium]|nr:hypothetical protein [Lachnospiraceae bacterium]